MLGDGGGLRVGRLGRGGKHSSVKGKGISLAGTDQGAQLADVPDRYRDEAQDAASGDPAARLRGGIDLLSDSQKFDRAIGLALDNALAVLEIDETPFKGTPEYLRILEMKQHARNSVLSTAAKIDEGRLRGKSRDRMTELLDAIKSAEKETA